jgi:hypothetical protein
LVDKITRKLFEKIAKGYVIYGNTMNKCVSPSNTNHCVIIHAFVFYNTKISTGHFGGLYHCPHNIAFSLKLPEHEQYLRPKTPLYPVLR